MFVPGHLRGGPVMRFFSQLGRIRVRLLVVNVLVVLVPVVGLEFADIYERQLLNGLERDMRNQATLVRRLFEADLRTGVPLDAVEHEHALRRAAERTRTRIRVLDKSGTVVVDSHRDGPPEGPEPPAPSLASPSLRTVSARPDEPWPTLEGRREIREAYEGHPSSYTRVRERLPAVFLFVTDPIMPRRSVEGVVYVVRSTTPVLLELHRIRQGLFGVMAGALAFTLLVTLLLAWSISRPLGRLSRAAKRIASGERDVPVPVGGGGEIRELGESFAAMTEELDERLRYISAFAADVAHEFKSPLTSIRGAAELLAEGAADDPEARDRFLRNILLDAERLDRHVSRLLELSRIEAHASETVREALVLEPLIRAIVGRASKREGDIALHWKASAPIVMAREDDLDVALTNLLHNALRFSPPDVPVEVTVSNTKRRLKITVRDHGPGVPEDDRAKIFARFFTTSPERDGTGLGLAIVKAVVEAHGGEVRHEVPEGPGAQFVLELPLRRTPGR